MFEQNSQTRSDANKAQHLEMGRVERHDHEQT
jgi:hypothetical protein